MTRDINISNRNKKLRYLAYLAGFVTGFGFYGQAQSFFGFEAVKKNSYYLIDDVKKDWVLESKINNLEIKLDVDYNAVLT